jgi:hypothetical protein
MRENEPVEDQTDSRCGKGMPSFMSVPLSGSKIGVGMSQVRKWTWVVAGVPAGTSTQGWGSVNGVPFSVRFQWPPITGVLESRALQVEFAPIGGGLTERHARGRGEDAQLAPAS